MNRNEICLVGGPHSGKRMPASGHVLKMPKHKPLEPFWHDNGSGKEILTTCPEDRYVLNQINFDGTRHWVYLYEYDVGRDFIELLTSELSRARGQT